MSDSTPSRLSKALLDAAVIVGSILLAFAIDAAWDARSEGKLRDAFSVAIGREMTFALSEVDRVTGFHQAGLASTQALLSYDPRTPLGPTDAPAVDSLLTAVFGSTASYDAPTGALNGLLTSGDLDLLDEPELLAELTAFPALVANLDREQRLLHETVFILLPHLGSMGVDQSQLEVGRDVPWELATTPAYRIVGDAQFRGIIDEIYWRYRNSLQVLGDIREGIERIQRLLD
jgi:hypothetical protein